jgi:outer membrane protein TolC
MQFSVSVLCARSVLLGIGLCLLLDPVSGRGQELPKIPLAPVNAPQPEPKDNGDKPRPVETGPELTLGECIGIAMERSPSLRALYKTYDATAASSQALNNIGSIGAVLAPDLPVRKQQAARGLIAAAADIHKKQNELVQDVTRLYYTVVYARQQEAIAEDVVAQIELLVGIAKDLLKSPKPGDINQAKVDVMELGLSEAKNLRSKARHGALKATAGLQQLMNVKDTDFPFRVKDKELTVIGVKVPLTKELVVERALAARPEVALAAAGLDAFRLEVYAQARVRCSSTVRTFASGSDIHARPVPPGSRGAEYRPEPLTPEMPPQLVGSQTDRVNRAMAYCGRAEAMYEDTRNLIALDATTAFLQLEEATEKLNQGKKKLAIGKDLMERTREGFDNPKVSKDVLVSGYVAASKAQSDYLEAVFEHLLALAALERITGGAIRVPFPNR